MWADPSSTSSYQRRTITLIMPLQLVLAVLLLLRLQCKVDVIGRHIQPQLGLQPVPEKTILSLVNGVFLYD